MPRGPGAVKRGQRDGVCGQGGVEGHDQPQLACIMGEGADRVGRDVPGERRVREQGEGRRQGKARTGRYSAPGAAGRWSGAILWYGGRRQGRGEPRPAGAAVGVLAVGAADLLASAENRVPFHLGLAPSGAIWASLHGRVAGSGTCTR